MSKNNSNYLCFWHDDHQTLVITIVFWYDDRQILGIPIVPASAFFAQFQDRTQQEISALQARLSGLQANTAQLSSDFQFERQEHATNISALEERITMQLDKEVGQHETFKWEDDYDLN